MFVGKAKYLKFIFFFQICVHFYFVFYLSSLHCALIYFLSYAFEKTHPLLSSLVSVSPTDYDEPWSINHSSTSLLEPTNRWKTPAILRQKSADDAGAANNHASRKSTISMYDYEKSRHPKGLTRSRSLDSSKDTDRSRPDIKTRRKDNSCTQS